MAQPQLVGPKEAWFTTRAMQFESRILRRREQPDEMAIGMRRSQPPMIYATRAAIPNRRSLAAIHTPAAGLQGTLSQDLDVTCTCWQEQKKWEAWYLSIGGRLFTVNFVGLDSLFFFV